MITDLNNTDNSEVEIKNTNKSDAKQLAKEIIKELNDEFKDKQLHNTRLLLKNYSRLKSHVEDVNGDITPIKKQVEEFEYERDDEIFISSMIKTKMRTAKMLAYIDESLDILEKESIEKDEHYKFKAFYMYYIEESSIDNLIEEFNCSRKMPYQWNNIMVKRLSVLLWGVSALYL